VGDACLIVAQHMDESGHGLVLETLPALTSLPVEELKTGTKLKAQRVYALPPHARFSIKDGKVKLGRTRVAKSKQAVIDTLFAALSAEYKEAVVGVVLSGRTNDGARGLQAINDHGGLAVTQDPLTAEHPSMPQNAISTGAVDLVLHPQIIWKEIASYLKHLREGGSQSRRQVFKEQIASSIPSICEVLHQKTQHDFKHYKTSTLLRRIQRRMQVLQIRSIDKYIGHLRGNDGECETLFKELLINVTFFFRDKDAFEALKTDVLQPLLKSAKTGKKIRIWVAGCSTGEEAYGIAILVKELSAGLAKPPEVQVIATDIDDSALAFARKGSYPSTIAEHVSEAR
ncbi:MAG TPA: chemotaxis protein CheB, partial [Bdellovibrionales bacterium]|nr:chemotaxis protein CheB [Bdellovibrionales bacterium]